jgi:DNA-binding NarL/FixJ family response regulator
MTNKAVLALVASSSGTLQNGLLALMTTLPQVNSVLVTEEVGSTLRMVENHQPALVILDVSSPDMLEVVREIKARWAHISLVVLAEDRAQQNEAEAAGADRVLIKGFSVQSFIAIVENVIKDQEDTPPVQANAGRETKPN